MITEWSGNRERDYTFVRFKEMITNTCRSTKAKKYMVPSVTIVRANAEILRVRLLRYVYQTMTGNADSSVSLVQ